MNIFTSTTFTWEALGMLKWASFLIGIAVGATWPGIFAPYAVELLVIGLLLSIYPAIVYFREH